MNTFHSFYEACIKAFLIIGLLGLNACGSDDESIQPKLKSITESIYSSITIQPDSLYNLYASATGIVEEIYVKEGDLVKEGQALIKIKNEQSELMEQNSQLNLRLAQENLNGKAALLNELQDQLKISELKYQNDSANFMRQQRLHEKNIGSEVEYENRKLQYVTSKNNYEILRQQLSRTKLELQTALKQAENNFQSSKTVVEDFLVKSNMKGKVYDVFIHNGEMVSGQLPLALIGSRQNFIIEMLVDEVDIVKLKIGQEVFISLDAFEGKVFKAVLTTIFPNKNQRTQTFKIEAEFVELPEVLYPGLSGEANILISERKNVLTIPIEYLMEGNKVKTADGIVEVEPGIRNMTEIEIKSGLDTNTSIYHPAE